MFAIPADDYDTYLRVVMAIKSELGDAGFELAREWAMKSDKFDDDEFHRKWSSIDQEGGVTIATMFALAREQGWRNWTHDVGVHRHSVGVDVPAEAENDGTPDT